MCDHDHSDDAAPCRANHASIEPATPAKKTGAMATLAAVLSWPMLKFILFYKRFLSPLKPPSCRFFPSCSTYTYEAITLYGPIKGGWMGTKRIARCQPFCDGGFDPVPGSALDERAKTDPAFLEKVSG